MGPFAKDDTLNTSFAEYLAFSLIFFYFFQVPHKLCCAPRAPAVRNLGARPPPAVWKGTVNGGEGTEKERVGRVVNGRVRGEWMDGVEGG